MITPQNKEIGIEYISEKARPNFDYYNLQKQRYSS